MIDDRLHYAKYTMVFLDCLEKYPSILDNLTLDTQERTNKLKEMLISKYGIYEIGGETVPQFKLYLENTFNSYKDYYNELISAYETNINMLDGIKETYVEEIGDGIESDTNNLVEEIDLPNKQTNKEYISNKARTNNQYHEDYTRNRQYTKTGGVNVIELKKDYMKLLRNVYEEFADKFISCFIQLFD